MAAPRLSDAQKQELVIRFRAGAGTQELAASYGCSPNTVTRVVKAAIEPSLYEELKRQRGRRSGPASESECEAPEPVLHLSEPPREPAESSSSSAAPIDAAATGAPVQVSDDPPGAAGDAQDAARGLAIDDADDFDGFDDEVEEEDDGDDPDDDGSANVLGETFVEVPISLPAGLDQPFTTPRPWCSDELPSSAYMLVDKTVELQTRPLGEMPELGRLDATELELQALVLYSNPRQAKRQCGRTQRVIKVPDVGVLGRTAPYLLRQGICRIVVEGALYALPDA